MAVRSRSSLPINIPLLPAYCWSRPCTRYDVESPSGGLILPTRRKHTSYSSKPLLGQASTRHNVESPSSLVGWESEILAISKIHNSVNIPTANTSVPLVPHRLEVFPGMLSAESFFSQATGLCQPTRYFQSGLCFASGFVTDVLARWIRKVSTAFTYFEAGSMTNSDLCSLMH